jgi:hypothetical protein
VRDFERATVDVLCAFNEMWTRAIEQRIIDHKHRIFLDGAQLLPTFTLHQQLFISTSSGTTPMQNDQIRIKCLNFLCASLQKL